ncbi:MAG: RNA 2',3'-cyclic phosphodiesterase [Chloroflexota bacterium]
MSELIRCFVAIELPEPVKAEMAGIQAKFKAARMDFLRWVGPSGIHLTLKFLGEVSHERVPEMVKAIEESVQGIQPFTLQLDQVGVFPNPRQPRVLWVGVGGEFSVLKTLQENVDVAFSMLGFPEEGREFKAHLTLARVRDDATPGQRQSLGDMVARTRLESASRFTVGGVNLMRSQLTPKGAIYTCLAMAPLGK